jgi:uncharacterized protein
MLPAFKAGKIDKAVLDGTQAILASLSGRGDALEQLRSDQIGPASGQISTFDFAVIVLFLIFFIWLARRNPFLAMILLSNNSFRFGSSRMGGFNFGGFSGGGGSFGGGGASGRW